jgi:hypothetical protein
MGFEQQELLTYKQQLEGLGASLATKVNPR